MPWDVVLVSIIRPVEHVDALESRFAHDLAFRVAHGFAFRATLSCDPVLRLGCSPKHPFRLRLAFIFAPSHTQPPSQRGGSAGVTPARFPHATVPLYIAESSRGVTLNGSA